MQQFNDTVTIRDAENCQIQSTKLSDLFCCTFCMLFFHWFSVSIRFRVVEGCF